MKLASNLYFGETAVEDDKKILKDLKRQKYSQNLYVICFSETEGNLFDIYSSLQLLQKYFKRSSQLIVGAAYGYDEAVRLVARLVEETFLATQNYDVRQYLNA